MKCTSCLTVEILAWFVVPKPRRIVTLSRDQRSGWIGTYLPMLHIFKYTLVVK